MSTIEVMQGILSANDLVAQENQEALDSAGIFAVNLMASPGAGKTSVILASARHLEPECRIGVIEGDLASRIDADTIAAHGMPVVQINTGGGCHLDAPMIREALDDLPLARIELLFIENVGNLVCPANFALGSHLNAVVASVPEGHDKPYKYPSMFAAADVVLLNKADLIDVFDFDVALFRRGLEMVNASATLFMLSCKTGAGVDTWIGWLRERMASPR